MDLKKILVPTDFSEYAATALNYAASLARDTGATLCIVHVQEDTAAYADYGLGGFPVNAEAPDDAVFERMLSEVKPSDDVDCSHKLLHGLTAQEIVQCAEAEDADLIVMGTHGRKGLTRLLMGSVAEEVVRKAVCPVLTVKQPALVKA